MVLSRYKSDRHPKPQPNSAIDVGAGLRINFHPHQQPKLTRPIIVELFNRFVVGLQPFRIGAKAQLQTKKISA